ncbi:MAG: hypothetical protein LCH30_03610 [Proteobacteria bacterium]|nr:hypothetical protein [Pseudomonadota bacterium]
MFYKFRQNNLKIITLGTLATLMGMAFTATKIMDPEEYSTKVLLTGLSISIVALYIYASTLPSKPKVVYKEYQPAEDGKENGFYLLATSSPGI